MNKDNLCVISTKNPNEVLLNTIYAVNHFYPEFDIVVVDSDSDNLKGFEQIPSDVKIEYIKNKNWELGAWTYAYNKYNNYKIYMFIQDGLEPIERIDNFDTNTFVDGTLYSFHFNETFKGGYFSFVDDNNILKYNNVYKDTDLQFLNDSPERIITGMAHTSFITNNKNVYTILKLEEAYITKNIKKTKIDSCISERTSGVLAELACNIRIDITRFFKKTHLRREYSWEGHFITPL